MHKSKLYHTIIIGASLLVVMLLLSVAQTPTVAQGANVLPDDQPPVPSTGQDVHTLPVNQPQALPVTEAPQPQTPSEEDCLDCSNPSSEAQSPSGNAAFGPKANPVESFILPNEEDVAVNTQSVTSSGSCPMVSEFNGSALGWVSHSATWYYDNQYLYTYGLANLSSSASYTVDFTNFDYQARLWRYGCAGCANRIIFRGTPDPLTPEYYWYSYYSFQYTRDGSYSVYKRIAGGESIALVGWTFSPAIYQGDAWNVLRVVANGRSLRFFMNGTLLASIVDTSLTNGRVGVGLYQGSEAGNGFYVDWARLCEVEYTTYIPRVNRK